jgi:ketosteroid isomerase-like protein
VTGSRATRGSAGAHRTSSIIAVLRVRDGKVVHWREYQDTCAILQAVAQP